MNASGGTYGVLAGGSTAGVYGKNDSSTGSGVIGRDWYGGVAIQGISDNGLAGLFNGPVQVTKSLAIDQSDTNSGSFNDGQDTGSGLFFGRHSGEGIASSRIGTKNRRGLDFYTAFKRRLSINHHGNLVGQDSLSGAVALNTGLIVDMGDTNNGDLGYDAIHFGYQSGEGISSKRIPGPHGSMHGLDFYTDWKSRMSIDHDGNISVPGDIVLTNSDCAEDFDILQDQNVDPGTVMVLNEEGLLKPSQQSYDKKVAGV